MKSLDCLVPPQKDDDSPSLSNEAANMVVDAIVATLKDITEVNKNNISEIMETAIEEIRSMVDADTIIGNPIAAGEVTVIPVSKITFGIASGGVDLKNKNND